MCVCVLCLECAFCCDFVDIFCGFVCVWMRVCGGGGNGDYFVVILVVCGCVCVVVVAVMGIIWWYE